MLLFWTPVLSGSYDVWGGTQATYPLETKENLHHIQFLPYRDAIDNVLCSTGKDTHFLTDCSRPNGHRYVAQECKVLGTRNSDALRTKQRNIESGLGCQDSWGGINSTYVDMRSSQAVYLNLKKSCGLREKSVNVMSSVLAITVDMLPFVLSIPATVPQISEIPEGLMNYPVLGNG
jgi:hypothetical protein